MLRPWVKGLRYCRSLWCIEVVGFRWHGKLLRRKDSGSWKPHWIELFAHLYGGIPADGKVIVTTDRGLYAKWMYQAIQKCHWHPFIWPL